MQRWAAAVALKHPFRHLMMSRAAAEPAEALSAVRDAPLPDGDGCEQHHGGHVVQKGGENGRDETEDDDHGPHSAPGQLIGLRGEEESG